MVKHAFMLFLLIFARPVLAQDPVETDGDKYKEIFKNERVRVLEYIDKPGDKTHLHHHPDSLVYALSPFKRKLLLNGDKEVIVEKKAGETYWVPAQFHIGENIGTTDTHVIIIELQENSAGK